MIERQLVLVELGEHGANVEVGVRLNLRALQTGLNGKCTLQKVESGSHFADATVVARHVIEGHSLAELVVLAEFLALLQQIQCTVDVLFLQVVDGEDIADLAQLLASPRELFRCGAKVHFLDFEQLFEDANRLNILALQWIKETKEVSYDIESVG